MHHVATQRRLYAVTPSQAEVILWEVRDDAIVIRRRIDRWRGRRDRQDPSDGTGKALQAHGALQQGAGDIRAFG